MTFWKSLMWAGTLFYSFEQSKAFQSIMHTRCWNSSRNTWRTTSQLNWAHPAIQSGLKTNLAGKCIRSLNVPKLNSTLSKRLKQFHKNASQTHNFCMPSFQLIFAFFPSVLRLALFKEMTQVLFRVHLIAERIKTFCLCMAQNDHLISFQRIGWKLSISHQKPFVSLFFFFAIQMFSNNSWHISFLVSVFLKIIQLFWVILHWIFFVCVYVVD